MLDLKQHYLAEVLWKALIAYLCGAVLSSGMRPLVVGDPRAIV